MDIFSVRSVSQDLFFVHSVRASWLNLLCHCEVCKQCPRDNLVSSVNNHGVFCKQLSDKWLVYAQHEHCLLIQKNTAVLQCIFLLTLMFAKMVFHHKDTFQFNSKTVIQ